MNMERDSSPTGFYNRLPYITRVSKTRRSRKNLIGPLKEGLLKKVGYNVNAKPKTRRMAVARAVKKYGRTSTIRKLNAIAVLTKRTSPRKSRKFKTDMRIAQHMKSKL